MGTLETGDRTRRASAPSLHRPGLAAGAWVRQRARTQDVGVSPRGGPGLF